jgi:hypothetical protein
VDDGCCEPHAPQPVGEAVGLGVAAEGLAVAEAAVVHYVAVKAWGHKGLAAQAPHLVGQSVGLVAVACGLHAVLAEGGVIDMLVFSVTLGLGGAGGGEHEDDEGHGGSEEILHDWALSFWRKVTVNTSEGPFRGQPGENSEKNLRKARISPAQRKSPGFLPGSRCRGSAGN